tara:strand:+ start:160 stop:423 length:264 start_codon:yes stop_codon:yes gene_type:complete
MMMTASMKKEKKKPQRCDLVEMCWDPRYSDLKLGIIIDFEDEYALVMWKEGDITREWPGNLTIISNRVRKDMAWYSIHNTGSKNEEG